MRTKAILAVVAAVGLVAVSVTAWRLAAARSPALVGGGLPERERGARAALHGANGGVPEAAEISARSVPSDSRGVPSREPLAAPGMARIRVVEADSGKAVPEARAWIELEEVDRSGTAWEAGMERFRDVEPLLQSGLGRELVLDEHGEAHVPQPPRELLVVAAQHSLHGLAALGPDDLECVVELQRYRSLTCEVVDPSGQPVQGALVALAWGEFDPFEHTWTWFSGADGRVWIPRLESHLFPKRHWNELRVFLAAGVQGQPECVTLDTDRLPEEPVRLVATEYGSVAIHVTDRAGKALDVGGAVILDVACEMIPDPHLSARVHSDNQRRLDGGHAVFECVGLGLPYGIDVYADGYEPAQREVLGPQRAGERMEVFVSLGKSETLAHGRVHGLTRFSRAGASFFVHGQPVNGYGGLGAPVDDDGTFEEGFWIDSEASAEWMLELLRDGTPLARARVTPVLDTERALDFGEVEFTPGIELARLQVVDDQGAELAGATVYVHWKQSTTSRWCDENGCCIVMGEPTDLPIRVQAFKDGWSSSEALQIDEPGSKLSIALERGATLQGRVEGLRGGDLANIELRLAIDSDEDDEEMIESSCAVVEGYHFRFAGCREGSARLSVLYGDQCVLERGGIQLRSGETTELVLDLREVLHRIELTFELESGEPWKDGSLTVLQADGSEAIWNRIGPVARTTVLGRAPLVDLWVAGVGAKPRLFQNVRRGDHLLLPSPPHVVLRVDGIRLPEPPLALVVHAERTKPEDVPYEPWHEPEAVVDRDGLARLQVPWPGEYELSWVVRNTWIGAELDIEQDEAQMVTVLEQPLLSPTAATLAPALVARAIEAAGG